MIVSAQTYNIILIATVILIALKPLFTRFINKEGNKYDWMFFLVVLLLPINWYTPTFITVYACGKFSKEILLFPDKKDGVEYSYGWNNYIINKSLDTLVFEYVYYGDSEREDGETDQIIKPGKIGKVEEVAIDFIFEPADESFYSKSSGVTKTCLYCM